MDSMRSLNKSLPSSNSNRPLPPEQLLQAFRTAALSVTNLYKSAVTDQSNSRQEGYQDALDDLLTFLDKENLGLQDGEGWRVRQWATERYERASTGGQQPDSDDEPTELEKRPRSASPRSVSPTVTRDSNIEPTHNHTEDQPVIDNDSTKTDETSEQVDETPIFRFTATQNIHNHNDSAMQTDETSSPITAELDSQQNSSAPTPIRVGLIQRGSRTTNRHGSPRSSKSAPREFTFTSGSKRKLQFPEFFDVSNLDQGRDGSGGGSKRGRFI